MRLTFLGTSSGVPTQKRNVTAIALSLDDSSLLLFDCGEGTQHQFQRSTLRSGKISAIFITHMHGDHCFGLPGLLCSISAGNPPDRTQLNLYGPLGLGKFLRTSMKISDSHLNFKYRVHEIVPQSMSQEEAQTYFEEGLRDLHSEELAGQLIFFDSAKQCYSVVESKQYSIRAAEIEHRIFTVGYVWEEPNQPGKLNADRLKQLGVPPGPMYAKIKNGEQVTLADGTVIRPEDVIGEDKKGRKVVILGDTCNAAGIAEIARDCLVITHESTLDDAQQELSISRGHSTPALAGNFARSIGAQNLIITHFSARYSGDVSEEGTANFSETTINDLLLQAKAAFGADTVFAADDFKSFDIRHGLVVECAPKAD